MTQRPTRINRAADRAADWAQIIAERDDAIAERDFLLRVVAEIGIALRGGRVIGLFPVRGGFELRSVYRSRADAVAVMAHLRSLRGMTYFAGEQEPDTAGFAAVEASAAASLPT